MVLNLKKNNKTVIEKKIETQTAHAKHMINKKKEKGNDMIKKFELKV